MVIRRAPLCGMRAKGLKGHVALANCGSGELVYEKSLIPFVIKYMIRNMF